MTEHYIEAYTQRGYIVDRAYRKAIFSRRTLDETAIPSGEAFGSDGCFGRRFESRIRAAPG